MAHLSQRLSIALLVLVFGLAATAHAGTRLYSGSVTYHAFGNDTTTGTTQKFQNDHFKAFPWHARCNVGPNHPQSIQMHPDGHGGFLTWTLPDYGGQALIHDIDSPPNGILDRAQGCLDCYGQTTMGLCLDATTVVQETE